MLNFWHNVSSVATAVVGVAGTMNFSWLPPQYAAGAVAVIGIIKTIANISAPSVPADGSSVSR